MSAILYNILLLCAIASQFAAYGLCALGATEWWYKFNAATHFILWGTLLINAQRPNYAIWENSWSNPLTLYGLLLAGNQLVDEFFLNPDQFLWNECLVLLAILIHLSLIRKRP